jgi:hypothetical protein
MYPLKTVVGQGKGGETGGADPQGIDGGADVVGKTGKSQLRRPNSAADPVLPFKKGDGKAGAGQFEARGQPIRAGAHDDGVCRLKRFHTVPFPWSLKKNDNRKRGEVGG